MSTVWSDVLLSNRWTRSRLHGRCNDFTRHLLKYFQRTFHTKLTHFIPLVSLYTPWKQPEISGFTIRDQCFFFYLLFYVDIKKLAVVYNKLICGMNWVKIEGVVDLEATFIPILSRETSIWRSHFKRKNINKYKNCKLHTSVFNYLGGTLYSTGF